MFERFTDGARRVVVLAQEQARILNHNYIGTEHLLLGLLTDASATEVLLRLGVDPAAVKSDVEATIGRGPHPPSGHIPFTPGAKRALELSLREALQLGHRDIGTEHLLLGLIREGGGVAAVVAERQGAVLEEARRVVRERQQATAAPAGEETAPATAMLSEPPPFRMPEAQGAVVPIGGDGVAWIAGGAAAILLALLAIAALLVDRPPSGLARAGIVVLIVTVVQVAAAALLALAKRSPAVPRATAWLARGSLAWLTAAVVLFLLDALLA